MEILNMVNYLYHEQTVLKLKYDALIGVISGVIEALRKEEIQMMNRSRVNTPKKCNFITVGLAEKPRYAPSTILLKIAVNSAHQDSVQNLEVVS